MAVRAPIGKTTVKNVLQGSGSNLSTVGDNAQILEITNLTIMCMAVMKIGKLNPPSHSCMNHLLKIVNDREMEYHKKAIDNTSAA